MKNKLQHKLYNYEVSPPQKTWEKIAASLDESHLSDAFPLKLYNLERIPPSGNWDKIASELSEKGKSVISIKKRFAPFIRYAAAAVIIGFFAFSVIWIINASKNDKPVALKENTIQVYDSINNTPIESRTTLTPVIDEAQQARDDAALEASKHTFAKLDISPKKRILGLHQAYISMPVEISRNTKMLNPDEIYRDMYYSSINSDIHIESDKYNIADRYIMLMTPEGNIFRMAKKWGDLLCCVSGEEQDAICKDQLMKWRNKIACAPIAPSPGNFLDILNLAHSLKD